MKRKSWVWLTIVLICTLFVLIITTFDGNDNSGSSSSNTPGRIFSGSIFTGDTYYDYYDKSIMPDWIFSGRISTGDTYYDKSSIEKVNKNIIRVWTKKILNEDGKKETFSSLKGIDKAPDNPDLISYMLALNEIDCVNEKVRNSTVIYFMKKEGEAIDSNTKYNKWDKIILNSVADKLKNILCEEHVAPKEAVAAAPAVTDKNLDQVNSNQKETKTIPKEAVQNLVNKWLTSWQSGDMKTYRGCYESDFQSKGMNLEAWVSHKTNVYQKSKNINISIDDLQISADANIATALFTQYYSSSILKDSGKKKLEVRKINNELKIYREIMQP